MMPTDNPASRSRPDVAGSPPPADDIELGRLVHDVADGWSMPPVRIDEPGWRERVRTPRAKRVAATQGLARRLGRAAGAAVALTVGAALLGVYLTRPLGPAGPTQRPGTTALTGTPSPRPSRVAASQAPASQLPKLVVNGDLPAPSQLIVSVESAFSLVDLRTGTIGQPIGQGQWGTDVRRGPDGAIYCICLTGDGYTTGSFSHMTATWNRYDASGSIVATNGVGDFRGAPDPRDVAFAEQQSQHVAVHVSYGPDPRYAFVGWTVHDHPAWRSGFVVVDVTTGAVLQGVDLPNMSDGPETSRSAADAPRLIGSIGGGRLAIARPTYRWSPPGGVNPTYHFGTDTYAATFDGHRLSGIEPLSVATQCGDQVAVAGALAGGQWWLGCVLTGNGQSVIRRVASDGHVLGDTRVTGSLDFAADPSATSAISPDGTAIYLWDPMSDILTRVDLASGDTRIGRGDRTAAIEGPLAALGGWLTPTAAAKVLLSSGIAISPDGSRLYALGVENDPTGSDPAGSAGVFVFDLSGMTQVAHWPATADFVSLAVSLDGAFVYAAGSPQANASGSSTQSASITVFNAVDGSIRLIAGQLGSGFLLLPSTTVR